MAIVSVQRTFVDIYEIQPHSWNGTDDDNVWYAIALPPQKQKNIVIYRCLLFSFVKASKYILLYITVGKHGKTLVPDLDQVVVGLFMHDLQN